MTSNPGDMFGDLFGPNSPFSQSAAKNKPEKGLPWEAKIIDGKYYIPLSQVADLLKENDVLPKVRKGIENRVEAQRVKIEQQAYNDALSNEDVETGLCNGQAGQLHPLCIVSSKAHDAHFVEVDKK
jgi:hypothetical protein